MDIYSAPISDNDIRQVESVAEDHGIDGVIAILARWIPRDEDEPVGLAFIQRIVALTTQAEIDELIPEEAQEDSEGGS